MTQPTRSAHSRADEGPGSSSRLTLRAWAGADLDAGIQEWRGLESRLGEVPLASSYLWTAAWLRVYRDLIPATILTAEAAGQTIGACLVCRGHGQKVGPVPLRTFHVGTAGEPLGHSVCVEYNGLLVDRPHRAALAAAVQNWLRSQSRVDEIRLDGWPAEELAEWTWSAPPAETRLRDCRYFDLDKARTAEVEPIELLGRSTRQNLRRLLRKYDGIETSWAQSLDEADEIFGELVTLHQARWIATGQPGAFASSRFESFQRQLLVQGFSEGKIVAFRARHDGETVGCLFLLVDRGRLLDYLSGFAAFDVKPSPGLVTHFLCLTEAGRRGFKAYDFLVGEKRHKDNLSTDVQQLAWASWRRRTLRNLAVDGLKRLKSLTKKKPAPSNSPDVADAVPENSGAVAVPLPPVGMTTES